MSEKGKTPNPDVVRVGIIGAAGIAKKVWGAIHRAGLVVTCVGGRNPSKTESFVLECTTALGITYLPRSCSYEDVVTSSDVDVVYIPIPVTQREEWVKKCIDNDKHVVGEKPPADNADRLKEWLEALHEKQLLYMDGTMFSHGPYLASVLNALPKIGAVRRMDLTHAWNADAETIRTDIRFKPDLEPHGALGDLGWYCIRAILHVMNFATPKYVTGHVVHSSESGAITAFSGDLTFASPENEKDTVTAGFYCGFESAVEGGMSVYGRQGALHAPNLYLPLSSPEGARFTITKQRMKMNEITLDVTGEEEVITVPEETGAFQEAQMWRNVASIIQTKNAEGRRIADTEESAKWAKMSWMTQSVMDSLMASARAQKSLQK